MISSIQQLFGSYAISQNLFFGSSKKLLLSVALVGLVACGGGGGGAGESSPDPVDDNDNSNTNTAPIARAGADQNVATGATVTVDASSSSDADGDTLTYSWSLSSAPNGSSAQLSSGSAVAPTFVADLDGSYTLSLTVNDGQVNSSADTVTVTAQTANTNQAPSAAAGSDQNVTVGASVNLDGSASTDADGDSLSYSWVFNSVPNGSNASLNGADTATPSFIADVAGNYVVALVVNDGQTNSSTDTVTITAQAVENNTQPSANAGNDKILFTGNSITLDGSNSSDSDDDDLSYNWTLSEKPAASTATITNADSVNASFTPDVEGTYVVSLVVNDGQQDSTADEVVFNIAHWRLNTTERSTNIQSGGQGVLVNVQSVMTTVENNQEFTSFTATGIPDYAVTMTQADIDTLNNRPNAATDFRTRTGRTSAQVGDVVEFGEDIGYARAPGCDLGYWPPGPECPSNQNVSSKIPTEPEPAVNHCSTGLNSIGVMLNGTAIFNWDDGSSYNNQNIWNNLAPKFEIHDVDLCLGHAQQQGNYHHHMFSSCLQEMMGDDGTGHSPIYGFAADGYPIYGPYHAANELAKPAWVMRDYNDANSPSGCGVAGARNCQLVDQYDLSKGTTAVASGPTTSETVTSMSGNPIDASEGIYFEDYYYDAALTAQGGAYLDEHNGHSHDNLGYHYHITVEDDNGTLNAVFPYQAGPTFYGVVPDGGIANCR